jgi:hypothetical protein
VAAPVAVGVNGLRADVGRDEAGGFAAFGRVLGQVAGDVAVGELAPRTEAVVDNLTTNSVPGAAAVRLVATVESRPL